jgi:ribosome silencing factor RsfS/YbeB/iojap
VTRWLVPGLLAFLATTSSLGAQSYFGQNQVQYDRFDWKVIGTEHFQVFYYPPEERAATDAARMAERAYARLSTVLRHQFREKKPIMLYASRADFGQNNVTGDLGEGTGGVTDMTDYFVIASGTSDTHVRAIGEHLIAELKKEGVRVHHVEGVQQGRWVLLDFVDFVVHIFHPTLRSFYQIERLWSDADVVPIV